MRRGLRRRVGTLASRVLYHPTGLRGRAVRFDPDTGAPPPALLAAVAGRVVVVTGASSGIGRATAHAVGRAGATVALVARRQEELEAVRAEIVRAGGAATVHAADLSDLAAVMDLADDLLQRHGRVDVLVNNAGRSIRRSVLASVGRFHDFQRTMQLNYFGAARLTTALLPAMCARGGGTIVHVSTIGRQAHGPQFAAYVASKAAFDAFLDITAGELHASGIRCTTVYMPLVRTPMLTPVRRAYRGVPSLSAAQAAELVCAAIVHRPRRVRTVAGDLAALGHRITPEFALRTRAAYHRRTDRS